MVKSRVHSSVATLEVHKTESGVETKCYEYKSNTIGTFGVNFDHTYGRHHPTY